MQFNDLVSNIVNGLESVTWNILRVSKYVNSYAVNLLSDPSSYETIS